ncbi:uncharacterized protein LOC126704014 [Quercus robur]|uniref:uncharacterized protein LOC126704014 n=1 Tax=Quercus robur TaxID=38942 RepID=UPI002161B7F7|nr:uncharacterized protein LOC126704014 [Quercus robur]
MEGSGLRQTGHAYSQRQDNFLNLERERDQDKRREGSINTSHTSRSRLKGKGHASQKRDNNRALQQEIDDLKKKLRRAQRRRPSPSSDTSDEEDNEYKQRSRTPSSKTFSYEEEQPHKRGHKSPSYKGLANDAMSKALDRISQSPFTRRIEGAELSRRFHQPTFAIYNGRTDPVEHPHDDALVVILGIGGYDVRRVLVNQGSAMEVMYPDLYKGLKLRPEDLTAYDSLLVSFEEKTVTSKGQIRLPIQTGSDIVEVDFIVLDAYSPYTAIVARPWLHALGVVSLTLHQKVKYPSEGQVKEVIGDQAMAQQCMVSAISRRPSTEPSTSAENGL